MNINVDLSRYVRTDVDTIIENESFSNAWVRALHHVSRHGKLINFGGGAEQKIARDAHLTIVLEGRALQEALAGRLHPEFPTKELIKQAYIKEWERNYDWRAQGFKYCYEDRIEAYCPTGKLLDTCIDQWKLAKEDIAQQIATNTQSNRNVIVVGNPSIDRFKIPDSPPCLREVWIRWEGRRSLSVTTTWRSRDLGTAWMTNIISLLSAVRREVAEPNGCEISQYVDENRSLHVYHYDWPLFNVKMLPVNPQEMK